MGKELENQKKRFEKKRVDAKQSVKVICSDTSYICSITNKSKIQAKHKVTAYLNKCKLKYPNIHARIHGNTVYNAKTVTVLGLCDPAL